MFLLVKNVLTPEELEQSRLLASQVRLQDGRVSNPHNTAKHNLQADMSQPEAQRLSQIAGAAISRNEEVQNFAFPKRMAAPLLSRYEIGMTYGQHSDSPFLPLPGGPLRSDISATLFLADPESYDGGELVIYLGTEKVRVKGEPGSLIVYPSTTLHEVAPVTRGARVAVITFIESVIPEESHREILFNIYEVLALEASKMAWENRTRLQFASARLHRMWAR